jgi:hypothetical protein
MSPLPQVVKPFINKQNINCHKISFLNVSHETFCKLLILLLFQIRIFPSKQLEYVSVSHI